jgi:hypothetical protein
MGKLSRRKGKTFEQHVATAYRLLWPDAEVRRSLQAHKPYEPDVVVVHPRLPWVTALWTECQHAKESTPKLKLQQAERDVEEWRKRQTEKHHARLPIVVWKTHGSGTVQLTTRLWVLVQMTTKPDRFPPLLLPHLVDGAEDTVITTDFNSWITLIKHA